MDLWVPELVMVGHCLQRLLRIQPEALPQRAACQRVDKLGAAPIILCSRSGPPLSTCAASRVQMAADRDERY